MSVNAAAIGAHAAGRLGQLVDNRDRIGSQRGVTAMVVIKTGLTAAAVEGDGPG
jgi:hypothetical protein